MGGGSHLGLGAFLSVQLAWKLDQTDIRRGLRQGDILSPYLFLFCTVGLISLLKKAERNNKIYGVQIRRGAHSLNHLLFVDDSVIFCIAGLMENRNVQQLLDRYELASGHKINRGKTSMVFIINVSIHLQAESMGLWR